MAFLPGTSRNSNPFSTWRHVPEVPGVFDSRDHLPERQEDGRWSARAQRRDVSRVRGTVASRVAPTHLGWVRRWPELPDLRPALRLSVHLCLPCHPWRLRRPRSGPEPHVRRPSSARSERKPGGRRPLAVPRIVSIVRSRSQRPPGVVPEVAFGVSGPGFSAHHQPMARRHLDGARAPFSSDCGIAAPSEEAAGPWSRGTEG